MTKCRCCDSNKVDKIFSTKLLKKEVKYFECNNCRYVFTEEPTWLKEAYRNSINDSDTGLVMRNLLDYALVIATLTLMGQKKSLVVDYAGGYGFLVRLLRDGGVNALWTDPFSKNLVAKGFDYTNENNVPLVTTFESFEHFVRPCEEMVKLLDVSPNILLTTSIIPKPTPNPNDWSYYGLEHGQHVGFFRLETLQFIANKFDLYLISDGIDRHFFSKQKYSYKFWRILMLVAQKMPKLLTMGLQSKTWDDHLFIAKKMSNMNNEFK